MAININTSIQTGVSNSTEVANAINTNGATLGEKAVLCVTEAEMRSTDILKRNLRLVYNTTFQSFWYYRETPQPADWVKAPDAGLISQLLNEHINNIQSTGNPNPDNPHNINATKVGLGNLDNFKQVRLDQLPSGSTVATKLPILDSNGKIPLDYIPDSALNKFIFAPDSITTLEQFCASSYAQQVTLGDVVVIKGTVSGVATELDYQFMGDTTGSTANDPTKPAQYRSYNVTTLPWSAITGKPTTYTPSTHTNRYSITATGLDYPVSIDDKSIEGKKIADNVVKSTSDSLTVTRDQTTGDFNIAFNGISTNRYQGSVATTDWFGSTTPYTLTIPATIHQRGLIPQEVSFFDSSNERLYVDYSVNSAGDVTIKSNIKIAGSVVIL